VLNAPGVIDEGYRGEVAVVLINMGRERPFSVRRGDRIAQLVICHVRTVEIEVVESLPEADRGEAGFGDTGR
jgi:dUTP pyrophosphatase